MAGEGAGQRGKVGQQRSGVKQGLLQTTSKELPFQGVEH